jgi:transitional endoplasmic reticulum ATPase
MKVGEGIDACELSRKTEGYSGAEIAGVCRESAMNALREDENAVEIKVSHILKALDTQKPRTAKGLLDWYAQFEAQRRY